MKSLGDKMSGDKPQRKGLSVASFVVSIVALALASVTALNAGSAYFGIEPLGTVGKQHTSASNFIEALDDPFSPIGSSPSRAFVAKESSADAYLTVIENEYKGYAWSGEGFDEHTTTDRDGTWKRCDTAPPAHCQEFSDFKFDADSRVTTFRIDGLPIDSQILPAATDAYIKDKVNITFGGANVSPSGTVMWTAFYIENKGEGDISFPEKEWSYQNRDSSNVAVDTTVPDKLGQASRGWVYVAAQDVKPGGWMRIGVQRAETLEIYWVPVGK